MSERQAEELVLTPEDQQVIWELTIGMVRSGRFESLPDAHQQARGYFVEQRLAELEGRASVAAGKRGWVGQRDHAGNIRLVPKG